jgi:hypothetical protein
VPTRVTRWVCEKIAYFVKIYTQSTLREKSSPKLWAISVIFINLPKVNDRPFLPNLVPTSNAFQLLKYRLNAFRVSIDLQLLLSTIFSRRQNSGIDYMKLHFGRRLSGVDAMITIFGDFCQFSAKKMAFFSKTNVMIKILHILALF